MAVVTGRRWVALAITLAVVAAACTNSSDPVASAGEAATDGEPASPTRTPLIVDTDLGAGDIMALAFLLEHPAVDVRALTVSPGGLARCDAGVLNALKLTSLIGVEVPVACGVGSQTTSATEFPSPWRDAADAFYGLELAAPTSSGDGRPAAQLIAETIASSDEPVTILTLGPLTNLAAALTEAPTVVEGIKHIYALAGAVDVTGDTGAASNAEWHLSLDPGAADVVLHSGVGITFVPLDATSESTPPGDIAALLGGADSVTGSLLSELVGRVTTDGQSGLLRDLLAASVVVDESVAAYQMIAIAIDDEGLITRSPDGVRARFAMATDDNRFAETFLSTFVAPPEDQEEVVIAFSANGRLVWKFDLESNPLASGGAKSRSRVADGVAYFVGFDDRIYALDAATGDRLWSRDLEEDGPAFVEVALSPEAFFFQNVTFGPENGPPISSSIEGVDRATGQEIWRVQLDVPTQGAAGTPSYQDGLVYYTADKTGIVAADALTGETVWTFDALVLFAAGAASVVDGTLYFGALDGSVYALDANTGEQRWRAKTRLSGFGVTSSPAVADGVVYFGSDSGQFLAVDADSGDLIWEFAIRPVQGLPSSPTIADGIVYFGVLAPVGSGAFGGLIALDAASGEELWRFGGPEDNVLSSPTHEDGVVYVLSPVAGVDGLAALDAQSGDVLWSFELGGSPNDSPVVVDGTVYFQANGSFFAVEPPA